ncbi:MAG TPA: DUF302 domain-containing protein [Acidobacteriota bacterium]|nr:DUF302 domain-containing protein [Acidobacteriota bacterium]
MKKTQYGYQITTGLSYDDAIAKTTAELKKEGFGVLTEIDMKKTLKRKIDFDFRRYIILGACNPQMASAMLSEEIEIGLLLPCNVIVYENDDGTATVSFLSPKLMLEISGRTDLKAHGDQAEDLIRRVAEAM